MTNTNTSTLSWLRLTTGLFAVLGLSLVGASTAVMLNASTWSEPFVLPAAGGGAHLTQTIGLHQAALAVSPEQAQMDRLLFVGMLLLLASFLLYAFHVVKMQERRTPLQRAIHWFQKHLDMDLKARYHAHVYR